MEPGKTSRMRNIRLRCIQAIGHYGFGDQYPVRGRCKRRSGDGGAGCTGNPIDTIVIDAHTLYGEYPPKIPESEIKTVEETGEIVLSRVVIPNMLWYDEHREIPQLRIIMCAIGIILKCSFQ